VTVVSVMTAVNTVGSLRSRLMPSGGHFGVALRIIKYDAKRPPKNINSEAMNKTIPKTPTGVLELAELTAAWAIALELSGRTTL